MAYGALANAIARNRNRGGTGVNVASNFSLGTPVAHATNPASSVAPAAPAAPYVSPSPVAGYPNGAGFSTSGAPGAPGGAGAGVSPSPVPGYPNGSGFSTTGVGGVLAGQGGFGAAANGLANLPWWQAPPTLEGAGPGQQVPGGTPGGGGTHVSYGPGNAFTPAFSPQNQPSTVADYAPYIAAGLSPMYAYGQNDLSSNLTPATMGQLGFSQMNTGPAGMNQNFWVGPQQALNPAWVPGWLS